MDRDRRWDRTKMAWDAMIHGLGEKADNVMGAIDKAYANGETDEFVKPYVLSGAELLQS